MNGELMSRAWLYFQYGWGRYGGWGVSALTLVFTFLTMMRVYMGTPVTLGLLIIGVVGVVFMASMVLVGRHSMRMYRGIVSMEHALVTANNPVWRRYIDSYIALVNYLLELEDYVTTVSTEPSNNDRVKVLSSRLSRAREALVGSTIHLITEWEKNKIS